MSLLTDSAREAVVDAVTATMEEQAFLDFTVLGEDETLVVDESTVWSEIVLKSPVHGAIQVLCAAELADLIIRTVEGGVIFDERPAPEQDAELSETAETLRREMQADTVAELANTIAGRMMADLVEKEAIFEISLPRSGFGEPMSLEGGREYVFDHDGHRLAIRHRHDA